MLATPGLTGLRDPAEARRVLLDDALRARSADRGARRGRSSTSGSGGGSPGIPLAVAFPERSFTLLEAERRKCEFLREIARELPNVEVVWGRAEEQPTDRFGIALAKALAKPPAAAELCLPLVAEGGVAILWVGETADPGRGGRWSPQRLAAELEDDRRRASRAPEDRADATGFPRRAGMAKKRPLA